MLLQVRDTPMYNTVELTQKNLQREMYKFYKENLYPLEPKPSFRHVLMWALATGGYSLNHGLVFGKHLSLASAEAAWLLALDPQLRGKDWSVTSHAIIDESDTRHIELFDDPYEDTAFDDLRVRMMHRSEDLSPALYDRPSPGAS